jgi:hypothetical protein
MPGKSMRVIDHMARDGPTKTSLPTRTPVKLLKTEVVLVVLLARE